MKRKFDLFAVWAKKCTRGRGSWQIDFRLCSPLPPAPGIAIRWRENRDEEKIKTKGQQVSQLVSRARRYSKKSPPPSLTPSFPLPLCKINRIIYETSFRIILCNVCRGDLLLFPSRTRSTGRVFRVEIIVPLANQLRSPFAKEKHDHHWDRGKQLPCFVHALSICQSRESAAILYLPHFSLPPSLINSDFSKN